MQLKIDSQRDALHPSEVVVEVGTSVGKESLVVARQSLNKNLLEVGQPLDKRDQNVLVELPRETNSGAWRIWVPVTNLVPQPG